MEDWFAVKKKDVIAELEKRKDRLPWGEHPDEKYRCLIFWEEGVIRMCVDEYYELDADTYECLRYYTTFIGDKIEDYNNLSEDEMVSLAYGAWCSGAR